MKTSRGLLRLLPLVALVCWACGGGEQAQGAAQDSVARNLTLAPSDTAMPVADVPQPAPEAAPPAPQPPPRRRSQTTTSRQPASPPAAPPPAAPAPLVLAAGTEFEASLSDTVSTRGSKVGQAVNATVRTDVRDRSGKVVIPAGSTVHGVISLIKEGENPGDTGKVAIDFTGVDVGGQRHAVSGQMVQADFVVKGRGVTGGEAAKVGAGAAAGALAGQLLGKNTKSTVIGAVVGAAAGAGVAAATRDQDVVIPAGARVVVRLLQSLSVPVGG